jgi:hypothetical protein
MAGYVQRRLIDPLCGLSAVADDLEKYGDVSRAITDIRALVGDVHTGLWHDIGELHSRADEWLNTPPADTPASVYLPARLEYLRSQIHGECISYGEIVELQGLAAHIEPGDVELLEWAGVPEFPEDTPEDGPVYREGMHVKLLQETPEYGAWATGYIERAYLGGAYDIRVRGHHLYRVTADKLAPLDPEN